MQDIDESTNYITDYIDYKIKVDDILKIEIFTEDPEATLPFNPNALQLNRNTTKVSLIYEGYLVDSKGNINFPTLGIVKVVGLTLNQIRTKIFKELSDGGFLVNPLVDIKLINSSFTILGEVNLPGRYEFIKNNLNILEAIGIAGDLTINGKRKDVKLIREDNNGNKNVKSIDLTKAEIMTKDFQVFPGDIIIVNPNPTRIKNAGIIGNSGTLLSLLSFILSSIIVIRN